MIQKNSSFVQPDKFLLTTRKAFIFSSFFAYLAAFSVIFKFLNEEFFLLIVTGYSFSSTFIILMLVVYLVLPVIRFILNLGKNSIEDRNFTSGFYSKYLLLYLTIPLTYFFMLISSFSFNNYRFNTSDIPLGILPFFSLIVFPSYYLVITNSGDNNDNLWLFSFYKYISLFYAVCFIAFIILNFF